MERWGYSSPRPENPFIGISLSRVCHRSGMTENSTWGHRIGHYNRRKSYGGEEFEADPCRLDSKISEVARNAMAKVKGLKLQDFLESNWVPFQS